MKKTVKILILFFAVSIFAKGEFEKLDNIELKMFGYQVSTDKSLDERVGAIEKILSGGISDGNINGRIEKIGDFLINDETYLSPSTKVGKVELFLFKNRYDKKPLLERVENIENFLFKKMENKLPITSRITRIYSYLFEIREEITLNGDLFKKKNKIKLNPISDLENSKEGDEIFFLLSEDIKGVAKSGSKIRAKVLRREKSEKNDKIKVMFFEMTNEELREINIYKKAEIIMVNKKVELGYEIEDIGIIG